LGCYLENVGIYLYRKKGKKMENKRNYEVRKTVFNHTCHFIYR